MQTLVRKIDVEEHANKEDMIANLSYRCSFDSEVVKVSILRDTSSFSMIYTNTDRAFDSFFSTF